jgi:HK97 family phage portal protein
MAFTVSLRNRLARFFGFVENAPQYMFQRFVPFMPENVAVTQETALSVATVWACCDVIAKSLAQCPWLVFQVDDTGRKVQVPPSSTIVKLLNVRPNSDMTAMAFREGLAWQALTSWSGGGYAEIIRDAAGRVVGLAPLLGNRMSGWRDEDGTFYYRYTPLQSAQWRRLEQWEVYELRGPSITGLCGENVIARAARTIGLSMSAEKFGLAYFANGTVVDVALKYPKVLTDSQRDAIKEEFKARHAGAERAHEPLLLQNGMEIQQLNSTPEASQLLDSRKLSVEEICRWFGVPIHLVQSASGSHGYGTNLEQLGISFVRHTLAPWERRMCQEADWKLLPSRGSFESRLDMSELMKGDAKTRAEADAIRIRSGAKTINEVRLAEAMNEIGPEGDEHLVEANMSTLDRVLTEPAAPAALPPAAEPPPEKEGNGGTGGPPEDLARHAIRALYTAAFQRYEARVRGAKDPARQLEWLIQDCEECAEADALLDRMGVKAPVPLDFSALAAELLAGDTSRRVADRLVSKLLEAPCR